MTYAGLSIAISGAFPRYAGKRVMLCRHDELSTPKPPALVDSHLEEVVAVAIAYPDLEACARAGAGDPGRPNG
jgi:hypothetical protein